MRIKGWERRLDAAIEMHAAAPFAYGASDCFLVFWDCAAALIGADAMPWPRPSGYSTASGAARALRRGGYADVAAALAEFPAMAPALARRGDGGLIVGPDGEAIAGVFTARGLFVKGANGPEFLSPLAARSAVSVG